MTPLKKPHLRAHPELAMLAALTAQLELLEVVLSTVHSDDERRALTDQARSMARVGRTLTSQIRAYVDLIDIEPQMLDRRNA